MPLVMQVLAPGFEQGTPRYALAVELCRITFPYLTLISITALQGGVLNALDRYGPFATAPILFNLALIGGLLLTPFFPSAAHALSWGEFAAGVIQVIWMMGSCWRAGIFLKLRRPRLTPRVRRLFVLMGPAAVGAGAVQINIFIDTMIGSLLPAGSISHLYYAERLYQLPLGVIGVAVGTALLPALARHVRADDRPGAKRLEARAIEASLLLSLPAAIALMVAGRPIMIALFARGAFTAVEPVHGRLLAALALWGHPRLCAGQDPVDRLLRPRGHQDAADLCRRRHGRQCRSEPHAVRHPWRGRYRHRHDYRLAARCPARRHAEEPRGICPRRDLPQPISTYLPRELAMAVVVWDDRTSSTTGSRRRMA